MLDFPFVGDQFEDYWDCVGGHVKPWAILSLDHPFLGAMSYLIVLSWLLARLG